MMNSNIQQTIKQTLMKGVGVIVVCSLSLSWKLLADHRILLYIKRSPRKGLVYTNRGQTEIVEYSMQIGLEKWVIDGLLQVIVFLWVETLFYKKVTNKLWELSISNNGSHNFWALVVETFNLGAAVLWCWTMELMCDYH